MDIIREGSNQLKVVVKENNLIEVADVFVDIHYGKYGAGNSFGKNHINVLKKL